MSLAARRDVFQAIADPTRRQIINLIAHQSMNLNAIAENFDISRPAISQHIKILTECGMVVIRQQGRERYCDVKLDNLSEVADWVEQYRRFWENRLDALELYLNKLQKEKNNTTDREIRISRLLNAPVALVWEVWTNPEHIKNWWGPDGFSNTISKMDVKVGGEWDLVMHGPDGTDYKNKSVFKEVVKHKKLVYEHISAPKFLATVEFENQGDKTHIHWHMLFETKEQFVQVVKTFKADEGLKQNIEKLNNYLQSQIAIRTQLKTSNLARTSTYLNFPGNTEEAFNFYRSVFRSEFHGNGIQRFGDIPVVEGQPPLSEADKKLILHVELPILGGHILMATDAPESMGFKVISGNNMHINLEPDSREETKRLFDALSNAGIVTMPLQDMFWGAYFGSCSDKFGINWMVNYAEKN
jgi:uncharacterized glyoxalase superfamily protein PhnB/uncharacterized protein YndB with AHSA1/START domain/DNA-binding transcriptional ArsR family regulator